MESKETLKKELQKKRNEVSSSNILMQLDSFCVSYCTQLEQQYQEKVEQVSKRERDMVQQLQRREEVILTFSLLHFIA